jgi:hypothetical protein
VITLALLALVQGVTPMPACRKGVDDCILRQHRSPSAPVVLSEEMAPRPHTLVLSTAHGMNWTQYPSEVACTRARAAILAQMAKLIAECVPR